jgi:hypothetical protein
MPIYSLLLPFTSEIFGRLVAQEDGEPEEEGEDIQMM